MCVHVSGLVGAPPRPAVPFTRSLHRRVLATLCCGVCFVSLPCWSAGTSYSWLAQRLARGRNPLNVSKKMCEKAKVILTKLKFVVTPLSESFSETYMPQIRIPQQQEMNKNYDSCRLYCQGYKPPSLEPRGKLMKREYKIISTHYCS